MKTKVLLSVLLLCSVLMSYGQWTYTNLSEPKYRQGVTTLGSKAYFAGGATETELLSAVEIYDVVTGDWDTVINLSVPRSHPVCVAGGTKVFIAGGIDFETMTFYDDIDIWDTVTGQWSLEQLSIPRFSVGAVSHGNKVLFAGGANLATGTVYDNVEIYDFETGTWSFANLSMARCAFAWAVVGDLAIFAGGYDLTTVTDRVDIYNFTTNTWSTATLSMPRGFLTASTVGNKVLIAGGVNPNNTSSDQVDIYDAETNTWEVSSLSVARAMFKENSASVNNEKVYFTGGGNIDLNTNSWTSVSDVIDIYDVSSGTWTTDHLSDGVIMHTAAGVGNNLIVAGGVLESFTLTSLVEIFHDPTLIHVPADYPTIQQGILAASPGDTVLVADGLYFENINFLGKKPLFVASQFIMDGDTSHIANTIINGSQPANPDFGSVVTFTSGEDSTSVLRGFTITGGTGTIVTDANARAGGGVFIQYSGGMLLNNHIEYNVVSSENWTIGGGVCAGGPVTPIPWIVLRGNRINHNLITGTSNNSDETGDGGGVICFYNLDMTDNEISYNEVFGHSGGGGAGMEFMGSFGLIELNIRHNTITHNKSVSDLGTSGFAALGGGMCIAFDCSGTIANNDFSFNSVEAPNNFWSYAPGVFIQDITSNEFVFENNLVNENVAITTQNCRGGGLSLLRAGGKYQNNVIQHNSASHGGGIRIAGSITVGDTAILINNTITDNIAAFGGGINVLTSDAVVINTIIWDNTAPTGASIYEEGSNLEVRYSDVEGDDVWPGEGNVNCLAAFLDDGYHLSDTCQLVESGIASILINGTLYECPAYDIEGDDRPMNDFPEIGADEVLIVSVPEPTPANNSAFNIYPNPASGIITIEITGATTGMIGDVSIFGITGKELLRQHVAVPKTEFNISALPAGVYFIKLIPNDQNSAVKVGKFVKN